MTQLDTQPDYQIEQAVQWMLSTPPENRPSGTTVTLREFFGLHPTDAVTAIRRYNAIRWGIEPFEGGANAGAS